MNDGTEDIPGIIECSGAFSTVCGECSGLVKFKPRAIWHANNGVLYTGKPEMKKRIVCLFSGHKWQQKWIWGETTYVRLWICMRCGKNEVSMIIEKRKSKVNKGKIIRRLIWREGYRYGVGNGLAEDTHRRPRNNNKT